MLNPNITRQIIYLRYLSSILQVFDRVIYHGKNRFHPLGYGLLSQLLGHAIFNPRNLGSIYLHPPSSNKLSFYLNDRYWSALVIPGNVYEPEVQGVLDLVLNKDTFFIDCGANIGYWSVYACKHLPSENIIAIEAFPPTFTQLQNNSEQNGGFKCILAGISEKDGDRVWLGGTHHSTMSLLKKSGNNKHGSWVNTITVDWIYNTCLPSGVNRVVIKLDIEGMETKVLDSAKDILKCNPLIIYEDHGKDKNCETSRFIDNVLGYNIFFWDDLNGLRKVDIDKIKVIKHSKGVGYNFFACHPDASFWFKDITCSF